MPIVNGKYVNPQWKDGGPPAINASELNAISSTLETGIPNASNRIGDIVFTERTDLGSDYLLCNGEQVNKTQYPTLWNLSQKENTSSTPIIYNVPTVSGYQVWSGDGYTNGGLMYANGYYGYMFQQRVSANETYNIKFAYSTSISGPWNTVDVSVNSLTTSNPSMHVCNNMFIMLAKTNDSAYAHIWYSSNPSTGFIDVNLKNEYVFNTGISSVHNIMYENGRYYIAFSYHNRNYSMYDGFYSNSLSSGWLRDGIGDTTSLFRFSLKNGKLYYLRYYNNDWTFYEKIIGANTTTMLYRSSYSAIQSYVNIGNVWYVTVQESYPNIIRVNYGTTPTEINATYITISIPEIMNNKDLTYNYFAEHNGTYFLMSQYQYNPIIYSNDMKTWYSAGTNYGRFYNCNKYMYFFYNGQTTIKAIDMEQKILPRIDGNGLYPMIKAK